LPCGEAAWDMELPPLDDSDSTNHTTKTMRAGGGSGGGRGEGAAEEREEDARGEGRSAAAAVPSPPSPPPVKVVAPWRRNKASDKLRYEDDFVFEIKGKQMVLAQDVANELDTVGLTVWDSSLVLMKFLEKLHDQGQFGPGMRVLELGSGCGPVSVAAAMMGAQVTATDVQWILALTKRNVELNQSLIAEGGGSVTCQTLYWGREEDLEGLPRFDIIIAADCIYKEKEVVLLFETIHKIANEKTKILLGYEQHNPESTRAFYVHINQYFDTKSVPLAEQDPYYQHPKIKLMWLIKKEYCPPPTIPDPTNWKRGH